MCAFHGEDCCARRLALVENEDLRALIAPPLQGEQREQDRLACPGRADNGGMADIAHMEVEPEGC